MKGGLQFLRTTFIGGLLFLVPIVVLALILKNALVLAHKVVEPLAANPHSGSVHFMPPDCVRSSAISTHEMMKCLKRIGAGSNPLLGGLPIKAATGKSH